LEPELPIIDPHHHLWDKPRYTYLFPDLLADVGSGHKIVATMYEQAREMYRADGPEELKSLGETEFVNGVAAMSASGKYGPTRCIAGIVGFVDLRLGSRAKEVLERHIAVSDNRLRGIRNTYVKLGGLGMKMIGFDFFNNPEPPSSQDLEKAWRPYIETCISAFGPQRAMFESNFPVDKGTCSYPVLWNAFKRIAAGYSADEKTALFSGAAKRAYRLEV